MSNNQLNKNLPPDRIFLGLILMALAMFVIPIRDGIAKHMTDVLPVFTIAWGTYVAAAIVAVPIALQRHGREALLPAGIRSLSGGVEVFTRREATAGRLFLIVGGLLFSPASSEPASQGLINIWF